MSDKIDIRVQIRQDLMKSLIFGIHARPPIGHILSFLGYSHEVIPIMQTLSHATRAYIINADGLPGFIRSIEVIELLRNADEEGKLKYIKRYQVIDFDVLGKELKEL